MVGYYRKFINRFADAARPLTKLTQKDCKFIWSDECQTGFEYLRTCLTESPILKYPDPHKRYVISLMDCKFIWSDECQMGFEYLRTCLTESPILKYPDPHKRYVIFTDASNQAAAAVLTQEYIDDDDQMKEISVAYLSAQFNDTQFKWSTVVKESYAIYHAIGK